VRVVDRGPEPEVTRRHACVYFDADTLRRWYRLASQTTSGGPAKSLAGACYAVEVGAVEVREDFEGPDEISLFPVSIDDVRARGPVGRDVRAALSLWDYAGVADFTDDPRLFGRVVGLFVGDGGRGILAGAANWDRLPQFTAGGRR
jgi:hypothetical protein